MKSLLVILFLLNNIFYYSQVKYYSVQWSASSNLTISGYNNMCTIGANALFAQRHSAGFGIGTSISNNYLSQPSASLEYLFYLLKFSKTTANPFLSTSFDYISSRFVWPDAALSSTVRVRQLLCSPGAGLAVKLSKKMIARLSTHYTVAEYGSFASYDSSIHPDRVIYQKNYRFFGRAMWFHFLTKVGLAYHFG